MKKPLLKVVLLFISFVLVLSPFKAEARTNAHLQEHHSSQSAETLKFDLRKLWIDHTIWTRSYIVSALADLPDKDKVLARLLKNQQDIGNAIKPYYGEKAGNQLADLLREHIILAGKVTEAVKSGNQSNLKKYNAQWHKNSDDIAQFLSKANPYLPNKVLKDLLYTHLKLLTDQVTSRMNKDWDGDITAYDKGEDHIIKLADAIAEGIVKQFPNKFQ